MTEHNQNNETPQTPENANVEQLDAAGKSLYEALRISFIILKGIMLVLVILFLISGFTMVEPDEQALVLRFGKIRGLAEDRLLGPGLHWIFPYPIDEIVKIPVAKKINLPIKSFWYYQSKRDLLPDGPKNNKNVPKALNPIADGYCITRGEKQTQSITGSSGDDYSIVHCKWQLTYQIDNPERFYNNVHIDEVKPGQSYSEVMIKSVTPILENLVDDAVVDAMVYYSIDEAIASQDRIPKHVKKLVQKKLDDIQCGITAVSIQLTDITWPRQVDGAFLASIKASQMSQRKISEAKGYAENTLNETAGPVAPQLLKELKDKTATQQQLNILWEQLAGNAQKEIAEARAYRRKIVESAKANADYLDQILPQYRKRPKLVIQNIYQDAVEHVLKNADEKMIIQPTEGGKGREIRILLNRDPAIKKEKQK